MATVREVTFDLLRQLSLTTVFGNPGSTEETFLQDFPDDLRYILGIHEGSVIGAADGYAQATRKPVLVNVHTAAGAANALGATLFQNRTPLIITAGQQTREMLLLEPWLSNQDPQAIMAPYVKWAYQPVRPDDVPAAFMRATCDEKSVAPRLYEVFSAIVMLTAFRPSSAPRTTSSPNSSSW